MTRMLLLVLTSRLTSCCDFLSALEQEVVFFLRGPAQARSSTATLLPLQGGTITGGGGGPHHWGEAPSLGLGQRGGAWETPITGGAPITGGGGTPSLGGEPHQVAALDYILDDTSAFFSVCVCESFSFSKPTAGGATVVNHDVCGMRH